MSVFLRGKLPFLPARKEKYEGYPPDFSTYIEDDRIFAAQCSDVQSFNVVTGEFVEMKYHEYSACDGTLESTEIPLGFEIKRAGIIESIKFPESTLAKGDFSCCYRYSRPGPIEKWELWYHDRLVETFVSRLEPIILTCAKKFWILIETWDRGYDIYGVMTEE